MENHDFEIAYLIAESKDLMQTWYQVDGCAHSPCYSLQHAASHISRFKEFVGINGETAVPGVEPTQLWLERGIHQESVA